MWGRGHTHTLTSKSRMGFPGAPRYGPVVLDNTNMDVVTSTLTLGALWFRAESYEIPNETSWHFPSAAQAWHGF